MCLLGHRVYMSRRKKETPELTKIVVGSDEAMCMWTDPLATTSTVDGDQLSVTAVC